MGTLPYFAEFMENRDVSRYSLIISEKSKIMTEELKKKRLTEACSSAG
jgi:hypothetical protein